MPKRSNKQSNNKSEKINCTNPNISLTENIKTEDTQESSTSLPDLSLNDLKPEINEKQVKCSINEASKEFSLNDIVWAKNNSLKDWPAKIIDVNKSPKNKKNYTVSFFGSNNSKLKFSSSKLKLYEEQVSTNKKSRIDQNLSEAIKLASSALQSNDKITKIKKTLDFDDIVTNDLNGQNDLNKREKRGAAKISNINTKLILDNPKTQLQQERYKMNKLKGEELNEACKTNTSKYHNFRSLIYSENFTEKNNLKKRCRSFDKMDINKNDIINQEKNEIYNSSPIPNGASAITFSSQPQPKKSRNLTTEDNLLENKKFDDFLDNLKNEEKSKTNNSYSRSSSRSSSPFSLNLEYTRFNRDDDFKDDHLFEPKANNISKNAEIKEEISSQEEYNFASVTLIIDSSNTDTKKTFMNQWFIIYLIEKLSDSFNNQKNSLNSAKNSPQISVYDISSEIITLSTKKSFGKLKEFLVKKAKILKEKIELNFSEEFDVVIKNDLVISLISDTSNPICHEKYESDLFNSDIKDLKYISLGKLDYENALFLHYYFHFNDAYFIEASILFPDFENINETTYKKILFDKTQIYLATQNGQFYDSIRHVINSWTKKENIFNKKKELGHPTLYVNLAEPVISANRRLLTNLLEKFNKDTKKTCENNDKIGNQIKKKMYIKKDLSKKNLLLESVCTDLKESLSFEVQNFLEDATKMNNQKCPTKKIITKKSKQ